MSSGTGIGGTTVGSDTGSGGPGNGGAGVSIGGGGPGLATGGTFFAHPPAATISINIATNTSRGSCFICLI
jgi:hypothetical protein